jgi:hypothetical protein
MFRPVALLLSGVVAALVAFAPATARAADEPKDIVAKAIKAHGGEDVLKHKAARSKAKGKINLPGVGEVEFTQTTAYMLPDKFRDTLELSVGGKSVTVLTLLNGDKLTIEVDGKAVDAPDTAKNSLKDVAYMSEALRLVPLLKDKKYELSLIGEEKVEGKKTTGIRVSAKGQKDISIYFEKETWLMTKIEMRTTDDSGNEITEERIITEYKKNGNGPPMPKKILVKRDGKTFVDAEMLELEYLEKIDDSEFKK